MSHWTKIKFQIKSIDALKLASAELGCELVAGQDARGYGGQKRKADYTIKVPNAEYDVAVVKDINGNFELETDFWGGSVASVLGKDMDLLKQSYSVNTAEIEAQKLGHSVHRELMENGNIKLHLTIGN